jgi:tetraacyldisaccharide 4'-kinase
VLTRSDEVAEGERSAIRDTLRHYNPAAPIYESRHAPAGFRQSDGADVIPLDALGDRRWFAFCGIGGPESFVRRLQTVGGTPAGRRFFPDHHNYTADDLATVAREAAGQQADIVVTTEKDWAKLATLDAARAGTPPIWRLDIEVQFTGDGGDKLLAQIRSAIAASAATR